MSNVTSKSVKTLLALLIAMFGTIGLTSAAAAVMPEMAVAQPVCGDLSSYDQVPLGDLPPEATDTAELIEQGGPYPYPQDGTVFQNREDLLPDCAAGYYHEYTVETPGSPDRGARRIVTGNDGEHFYTDDHYASFVLIDLGGTPSECGNPAGLTEVPLSSLPAQVADTLDLVAAGGPFPFPDDGAEYQNRESVLPDCAAGYYRLYTVPTPGVPDKGNRRLITGSGGENFYTPDRYASFVLIDVRS